MAEEIVLWATLRNSEHHLSAPRPIVFSASSEVFAESESQ